MRSHAARMKQHSLRRVRPIRWRDLRLWFGITLVIAAMVLGAALLSGDDERTMVWRAVSDMAPGAAPIHVEPVLVSLGDAHDAYLDADSIPSGVLQTPIMAGQLIPKAAIAESNEARHHVTLGVEAAHAPVDLQAGHLVDVWVTPEDGPASLVYARGLVVHVVEDAMRDGMHVVLAVDPGDVADVIGAVRSGSIDMVAVPVGGNQR